MTERNKLLESIVETTTDYRQGVLAPPTPDHIDRWVKQFADPVQLPILQEMDHVLKKTYFSRKRVEKFLMNLFKIKDLVGEDSCAFWESVKFLNIQNGGASQKEMLALFNDILDRECGLQIDGCGKTPRAFVYLDDGIFTGNRVRRDFETWVASKEAPAKTKVHIVTIALHKGGQYYARERIEEAIDLSGKEIDLRWWKAVEMEDRRKFTDVSDVLKPTTIPEDDTVKEYVANMYYRPLLRNPGNIGRNKIFSSDAKKQLLEQEFLKAGIQIRRKCPNLSLYQRPLGNSVLETLGFGSLIVTFRNCPNNAPLALWAGNPWYPLFDRVTNTETSRQEGDF